jgi:hypothetical protein
MLKEHPDFYVRDVDYDLEPVMYQGQINHITEHFEAVLSLLYGNSPIDLERLERSLDEVANGLGLKLPITDINLCQPYYDTNLCQEMIA